MSEEKQKQRRRPRGQGGLHQRVSGGPWIAAWQGPDGKRQRRSTGTTCRQTAARLLARWVDEAAQRTLGLIDARHERRAIEAARPVAEHLAEWRADLAGRGNTAYHVEKSVQRAERVLTLAGVPTLGDLSPARIQAAIGKLRNTLSVASVAHYARAIKMFSRWAWRDGRTVDDCLAGLRIRGADTAPVVVRRAPTEAELVALIHAAERGPVHHGLTGADRAAAYRLASGTGLRVSELKSLTPESFDLKSTPATVTVRAAYSKRRRQDCQPLSSALVAMLRGWLASKTPGEPVLRLPGRRSAEMLRVDLAAAGVPYTTADGVFDFHAQRHGYISELVASGASVKVAQELARHSCPTLTIGRYGHTRLADVAGAVEALPVVGTAAAQEQAQGLANGTDGKQQGCGLSVYLTGAEQPQTVRNNATSFVPPTDGGQGESFKKAQQKRGIMRHPADSGNEKPKWRNWQTRGIQNPVPARG